jgi:pimeloyl-ACP methyl ester carboxylesterase
MNDPRMLRLLTVLSLLCAAPLTTAVAQEPEILSANDVKSLNKKAADWFSAWFDYTYVADSSKARRSAGAKLSKAKEAFDKDLQSKSRKADPLSSVADVRAVFSNVIGYERQSSSGILKNVDGSEDLPGYALMLPKRYAPDAPYRTVLVLPGFDAGKGRWTDAKSHYDATWGASSLTEELIVFLPGLDAAMELDLTPDFAKPGADQDENNRLRAVLGAAGQVQRSYHVDREALVVDAGDGASAFALRLATYFPNRFAGLVLRHPVDVTKDLRFGSLNGVPVLLLASDATRDACTALAKRLNELNEGSCTVLDGKGAYPFQESQAEVDAWVKSVRRNLTPPKIVIEPNHDAFNDAYWVRLGVTESLLGLPEDQKPRLVAEADKETNRIKVEARGISDFLLLLNDDLVDLDKEFTVEVNGVLFKEKRDRDLSFLVAQMQEQYDTTWVFTTSFATTVPKAPTTGK